MPHRQNLYRGYSTFQFQINKSLRLTDIELVQRDILNHIFTMRGTRVMMPEFGSSIPILAFEPLDEIIAEEVYNELFRIFEYDPRVELLNLQIFPDFDGNALTATARLRYIELELTDDFDLNIEFET